MQFFWFLTCCLAARQDEHSSGRAIKKRVKKYRREELKRELEALGVHVDGHGQGLDENKNKKELQKLLIKELMLVEDGRTGQDKRSRERAEGLTLPMEIPEDVLNVLNDLDAFLDKELEECERIEQRDNDVKAVLDSLLDEVDPTLEGLKDKGEKERVLRPEVGDRKEEAKREANFWSARENHKGFVPRRRFQGARHSSIQLTL